MRTHIPGILRAVDGMAWAIVPEKLQAILDVLESRAAGHGPPAGFVAAAPRKPAALAGGKIALLPLYGVVSQRAGMMSETSGGTSTELFGKQFDAAVADPTVQAIVIDVDSPGGAVDGVPELAAKIYQARGSKRVVAVCNSLNASAAYWISSAADQVVATPSGTVGSIGIFTVRMDTSVADAQAGVKYTVIKAGKYKAGDLPFEPLSDEERTALQGHVDELYDMFAASVAQHRGASVEAVRAGYGQGRVLSAKGALAARLVDRVATLDQVLAELGAPRGAAMVRAQQERAALAAAESQSRYIVSVDPDTIQDLLRHPQPGIVTLLPVDRIRASTVNHQDDPRPGVATDPARDPTDDPNSTTAPSADAGDAPEPYTPAACPQCDAPEVDVNGVCPNCGWVDPDGPSAIHDTDASTAPKNPTTDSNDPLQNPTDRSPDGALHLPATDVRRATSSGAPPSPVLPAPKATETLTMPEVNGTATADAGAATAQNRIEAIVALAAEHNRPMADVQRWIAASATAKTVSDEILVDYKKGARPVAIGSMTDRAAEHKFTSLGEQLHAVVQAGLGKRRDPRLESVNRAAWRSADMLAGSPAGMDESVGSDGGFFIQQDLLPGVIAPMYADDPILSRCTRIPIGAQSNSVKFNVVDETSRATGSRFGGIQVYSAAEADTATASKPKLRQMVMTLNKVLAVAYLTDELTQDAPAAEALLVTAFQTELRFWLASMIFKGLGGGQPFGFLNSAAFISVAIESGQTIANTNQSIGFNVTKMLARIPAPFWGEVIFLYNQDLFPKIVNATIGSAGVVPLFIGAGGLAGRQFDSIVGRPAFASEMCEAEGTAGDIVAIAPSQYYLAEKGGPQTATSVHVKFLTDETALRITYRIDGAPLWRTSVTPYKGSNARSPYVGLATRT